MAVITEIWRDEEKFGVVSMHFMSLASSVRGTSIAAHDGMSIFEWKYTKGLLARGILIADTRVLRVVTVAPFDIAGRQLSHVQHPRRVSAKLSNVQTRAAMLWRGGIIAVEGF